jgi:hypothetical protein
MMRRMMGRFLAICGWLADLIVRPLRRTPSGASARSR